MSLYALTKAVDISAAFAGFTQHFAPGFETIDSQIEYMGVTEPASIRWHPELRFWVTIKPNRIQNRYWCAFGVDSPHDSNLLTITCEINPPHAGIDRLGASVFVRSDNGTIYIAHNGGIGGGKPGIGKAAFLRFYGDRTLDWVTWPDKQEFPYIIIGALDDDEFCAQIAEFVHKVAEFKRLKVSKAS